MLCLLILTHPCIISVSLLCLYVHSFTHSFSPTPRVLRTTGFFNFKKIINDSFLLMFTLTNLGVIFSLPLPPSPSPLLLSSCLSSPFFRPFSLFSLPSPDPSPSHLTASVLEILLCLDQWFLTWGLHCYPKGNELLE